MQWPDYVFCSDNEPHEEILTIEFVICTEKLNTLKILGWFMPKKLYRDRVVKRDP